MTPTFDLIIAGAGPAGLLLAAAAARRGLEVAVVAPHPEAPWTPRYAAWTEEVRAARLDDAIAHAWPRVGVRLDDARSHVLRWGYATLDNLRLQRLLLQPLRPDAIFDDRALEVQHERDGATLRLASGRALRARAVVDASGALRALLQGPAPRATAWQTAWGAVVRAQGSGLPTPEQATLMDFSGPDPQPAFLYAMHLGDDRYFLEETVLIQSPAVPHATLRDRLHARLRRTGVTLLGEPEAVERCTIPMNLPLPDTTQRTLAFGAAASMIHPATGYQLGYLAAHAAPRVADALAAALRPERPDPDEVAHLAWDAIWPAHARRTHALHLLGARAATRFDAAQTRTFFDAFFQLPQDAWSGYLARTLSPAQLIPVLWKIYRRCPDDLRAALRGEFIQHPDLSARALLGVGTPDLSSTPA